MKFLLPFVLVAVTAAPLFAEPQPVNGIAAVVNSEVITQAEVEAGVLTQVRLWHFQNPQASQAEMDAKVSEVRKAALNDLIDRKLILAEFKDKSAVIKDHYVDDAIKQFIRDRFEGNEAKFYNDLKASGLTTTVFRELQREQIIIQAMRAQNSGPRIMVNSPEEKRTWYGKNESLFAEDEYVKLRMLSIQKQTIDGPSSAASQEKLVNEIRQQLLDGGDFATLAQTYSQDSFADKGGMVGTIGHGVLNDRLTDIAFGLKPQQVSEVIDDGINWRLLYVDARQGGAVQPFSEVEDQVDKFLKEEKRREAVDRWLNRLRKSANIKIFEGTFGPPTEALSGSN